MREVKELHVGDEIILCQNSLKHIKRKCNAITIDKTAKQIKTKDMCKAVRPPCF